MLNVDTTLNMYTTNKFLKFFIIKIYIIKKNNTVKLNKKVK